MADSILSANSASPRELKRAYRAALSTGAGTDSSMAALIVQRPSPESETRPPNCDSSGSFEERRGRQVEQPRGDHAAAPPHLGYLADIDVVLVVLGVPQRRRLGVDGALRVADIGVVEDVEPLGVGGHDAVLDAVVDHLDEVPRAVRPAVQVALLGRARARFPRPASSGRRPCRGRAT